jgi:phytoene desaturase
MKKDIKIIGSGFAALAASCYLAQKGHQVSVYEKNSTIGGT